MGVLRVRAAAVLRQQVTLLDETKTAVLARLRYVGVARLNIDVLDGVACDGVRRASDRRAVAQRTEED